MSKYPEQLHRDSVMCSVMRERKWVNVCFTDLTPEEQKRILEHNDVAWICQRLTEVIREYPKTK